MEKPIIGFQNLPSREGEALVYVAMGFTSKEAARSMNCSNRNIDQLILSAINRLKAVNRVHLITKAFQKEYLRFLCLALFLFLSPLQLIDIETDSAKNSARLKVRKNMDLNILHNPTKT